MFSEYRLADAISGREAEAAIGLRNQWTLARGVRLSTGFERVQSIAGASREATAVSAGLEYTASARLKGTGRLEWRQDSSSDSWLSTVGVAQRLSRDWTLLAQELLSVDRARSRVAAGAGPLLDRRGVPGYDEEPAQPADALRVQSRRHARPGARPRDQSTGAGGVDARRRPPVACVDVLGPVRGEVRRRSNGGQPRPSSASSWSRAASASTSHRGGISAP